MKKQISLFLAALILIGSAGCANVQRKFVRKKKEPSRIPAVMYVDEGPYQKKFSNEYYYKTHYTLWKTWHDELLNQLGGNHKKVARCAQESYGHLTALIKLLDPETAAGLAEQQKDLGRVEQRLSAGNYTGSDEGGFRTELERIRRMVANDYYYNKVKEHVLPEVVDLGAQESTQDVATSSASSIAAPSA